MPFDLKSFITSNDSLDETWGICNLPSTYRAIEISDGENRAAVRGWLHRRRFPPLVAPAPPPSQSYYLSRHADWPLEWSYWPYLRARKRPGWSHGSLLQKDIYDSLSCENSGFNWSGVKEHTCKEADAHFKVEKPDQCKASTSRRVESEASCCPGFECNLLI